MTLNGVIALILRYLTEFDGFGGRLRHGVEDEGPIMSAEYSLPLLAKTDPRSSRGEPQSRCLSAIAELYLF